MSLFIEEEGNIKLDFDTEEIAALVIDAALELADCPYEAEINLLLTENAQIHEMNLEQRGIDRPTDVLSFPMGENGVYEVDPETNSQILGDIVISMEKVLEQSKLYGHSLRREVAYLTAHGMLHLLGYDHEQGGIEKMRMREREDRVLDLLGFSNAVSYVLDEEETK